MSSTYQPLVAMCHEAVKRIRAGEARYDEELDRLCERFDAQAEDVRPILDRIMEESNQKSDETT